MARVRVRQHVNPLSDRYQQAISLPDWEALYGQLDRPWFLDLGCARGRFILEMAKEWPQWNFLGVEIREALVVEANAIAQEQQLTNLRYLFANVNRSGKHLLHSLPLENLQYVAIQFPDPWFKKKHFKRRVVQPSLVETFARMLPVGVKIFVQSDVEAVALEMRSRFADHDRFHLTHDSFWLPENPFPVPTERETATLNKGEPVYRALLEKR